MDRLHSAGISSGGWDACNPSTEQVEVCSGIPTHQLQQASLVSGFIQAGSTYFCLRPIKATDQLLQPIHPRLCQRFAFLPLPGVQICTILEVKIAQPAVHASRPSSRSATRCKAPAYVHVCVCACACVCGRTQPKMTATATIGSHAAARPRHRPRKVGGPLRRCRLRYLSSLSSCASSPPPGLYRIVFSRNDAGSSFPSASFP